MTVRARPRSVIVVTGAGGFLGSHVLPLVRRSAPRAQVFALVRTALRQPPPAGVEVLTGDLQGAEVWQRLPAGVTHLIHLAARIPWDRRHADGAAVVQENLAPIAQVIEISSRWTSLRHVTYGSSVSVYQPTGELLRESSPAVPSSVYGAAKLCGEHLFEVLRARGIPVASLRYSSLYGPGQYQGTVLPLLAERARRGRPLEVFNARRVQDFLHVDDAARATVLAFRKEASGPYNIGAGRSVSMALLAKATVAAFASSSTISVDRTVLAGADRGTRMHIGRASRELGYSPRIALEAGLRRLARTPAGSGD